MNMFLVRDICLIEVVEMHTFGPMRRPQLLDKVALELARELLDLLIRIRDGQDISYMRFSLSVAFEAIFVTALLLADLTIPSEPLKSFAAHLIRDIFARSHLRSWHVVNR